MLLLVLRDALATHVAIALAKAHLRDFLEPNLNGALRYLSLIGAIVQRAHAPLAEHLRKADLFERPFFALPWLITWFAHTIDSIPHLARLFDTLIASHPTWCAYLSAAVVLLLRDDILALPAEMDALHAFLTRAPCRLPPESIIAHASVLEKLVMPSALLSLSGAAWRQRFVLPLRWPADGLLTGSRAAVRWPATTVCAGKRSLAHPMPCSSAVLGAGPSA